MAGQAIHPCTIVAFYGGSALVAAGASATPAAACAESVAELGSYAGPTLNQAAQVFTSFVNTGRQLATRAISFVASNIASGVQSVCDSIGQ